MQQDDVQLRGKFAVILPRRKLGLTDVMVQLVTPLVQLSMLPEDGLAEMPLQKFPQLEEEVQSVVAQYHLISTRQLLMLKGFPMPELQQLKTLAQPLSGI